MTDQQDMTPIQQQLSGEEYQQLQNYLAQGVQAHEQQNVHTFLHKVATSDDTTKVGNLFNTEVGMPHLPVRTLKDLGLFCREIGNMSFMAEFLEKRAEIVTSTSLSRNAKLIDAAITSQRQVADVTKQKSSSEASEKKGWFGRKKKGGGGEE